MAVAVKKARTLPTYDCDSSVNLGDYVAVGSSGELILAKADNRSTMPCIGRVTKKVSSTQCKILGYDIEEDLTGIINRQKYFVSTTTGGQLQSTPPSNAGEVIQSVAQGIGTTKRKVIIDPSNFVVRS